MRIRIFTVWVGDESMSMARLNGLDSIKKNSEVEVSFVNNNSLSQWISDLHPAYPYLSATHKADYLRCRLMDSYGGGYADIKPCTSSWKKHFISFYASSNWALGYTEIGPNGVANVGGSLEQEMKEHWQRLIGNGAYIMKANTEMTKSWVNEVHSILDRKLCELRNNPAKHPRDASGHYFNGTPSKYPIKWTEIHGDIFHPLVHKHNTKIMHGLPTPDFTNYR